MANLISEGNQKILNSMCQGAKNVLLGDTLVALQSIAVVNADLVLTANGAAVALVAARNVGVLGIVQSNASGTANLGGSVYLASLTQPYQNLLSVEMCSVGQVPAVSDLQVVGNGVSGGIATVVFTGSTGETITLTAPGMTTAVITSGANGNDAFTTGNGGTDSANNFVLLVNKTSAAAGYSAEIVAYYVANGVMPFTAMAIGTCVILVSRCVGATIKSSDATKSRVTTDVLNTVSVARVMQPGIVFQTAVGVTATTPANGDELLLRIAMQR